MKYLSQLVVEGHLPLSGKIGWGGWTRANTVVTNNVVSYQLDHAPTQSYYHALQRLT